MATQTEDNNGLYFIVGGLVVVVGVMAFLYFNNGDLNMGADNGPTIIQNERVIEKAPETQSKLQLNVDRDGVSASSTQE